MRLLADTEQTNWKQGKLGERGHTLLSDQNCALVGRSRSYHRMLWPHAMPVLLLLEFLPCMPLLELKEPLFQLVSQLCHEVFSFLTAIGKPQSYGCSLLLLMLLQIACCSLEASMLVLHLGTRHQCLCDDQARLRQDSDLCPD